MEIVTPPTRRQSFHLRHVIAAVAILAATSLVSAAPAAQPASKPAQRPAKPRPPQRHQLIDHGPFVTATIPTQWAEGGIVNKGVAVKLTAKGNDGKEVTGGILFDTDTCRVAAGWVGGFVEFTKDWTSVRDSKSVRLIGTQAFGTKPGPGWAKPGATGDEAWKDPRPQGFGPLPKEWVTFRGVRRIGGVTALAYAVGNCGVLEDPFLEVWGGQVVLDRGFEVEASDRPLILSVCSRADGQAIVTKSDCGGLELPGDLATRAVVMGQLPKGTKWLVANDAARGAELALYLPPRAAACGFTLKLWTGPRASAAAMEAALVADRERVRSIQVDAAPQGPGPMNTLALRGGSPQWPETITTSGKLADPKKDAPYVVDTLTLPDDNPWKSWMRPGGFDFFTSDPTKAAICNWSGDVWTVSGITGDLKELKWRRIASGLFQPLGLRIVNDQIYVLGRDQITRLVDLNGDGETDFYENFNNDVQVTPNFHEFAFDLQTDTAGNFYFAKGGPVRNGGQGYETIADHHGAIMKVTPDGKQLSVVATGFRAPTGIGVGPDGQITAGDNEGSWVPKCRIAWVKPGGFYGVVPTSHRNPPPTDYDRPLCWLPKNVDNSSGGQVWVTSDKWGDDLKGRLLHLSYGTCSLFLVMKEEVKGSAFPNGQVQGGVVRFPLSFDSGTMRARFNPADGQLYVAGLKGWQTSAGKDGCFQRVRYTGKPLRMPTDIRANKTGLAITFSCALDKDDGNDPESFAVERWNYIWKDAYGSPDVSVADPAKSTHDTVKLKRATLQPDGKTVVLELEDMRPAMQYKTEVNLRAAEGEDLKFEVYHTVHQVP